MPALSLTHKTAMVARASLKSISAKGLRSSATVGRNAQAILKALDDVEEADAIASAAVMALKRFSVDEALTETERASAAALLVAAEANLKAIKDLLEDNSLLKEAVAMVVGEDPDMPKDAAYHAEANAAWLPIRRAGDVAEMVSDLEDKKESVFATGHNRSSDAMTFAEIVGSGLVMQNVVNKDYGAVSLAGKKADKPYVISN